MGVIPLRRIPDWDKAIIEIAFHLLGDSYEIDFLHNTFFFLNYLSFVVEIEMISILLLGSM